MAALVAGVQYGLSSHNNFHENKSLIFVKLTDSAQRAIEDYLRNREKINLNPTIQFLGNEGKLSFPSNKSSHGNFTFSLSSNQDIEGPQGGFECVQQTGPKNLESLGTLPCKMRIQANDDVYETTRHRMHVAEENNKNKCTRVIKANEPIGRKVKVKGTVRSITPLNNINTCSVSKNRESSVPTSIHQSAKSISSQKTTSSNIGANRLVDTQKKVTDIMRRPLKERLIHLLALRPFKRPELYDRIIREGVRDKEKNAIATVLKQIAFMRDNTYHLHRCVWNDIQEDWPFYTEQEKAMLKRRKPQNLTPPGSSDGGSSGSGQSPNSTHPGSPPTIGAPPPLLLGPKRPGYYQGNDGLPTKRQRISHYRKPEPNCATLHADNLKSNVLSTANNSIYQKRQRQQPYQHQSLQQQQSSCITTKSDTIPISDIDDINTKIQKKPQEKHQNPELLKNNDNIKETIKNNDIENTDIPLIKFSTISVSNVGSPTHVSSKIRSPGCDENQEKEVDRYNGSEITFPFERASSTKSLDNFTSNTIEDTFLSFPDSPCNRISHVASENFRNSENPDYLTCYSSISSAEQRTRYKAEFNADYKEYRKLHVQVVKISKQFSLLEEELKKKQDSGNIEGYEAIKHQILQEYAKTKNVNARFYYLHDKLGHIKQLVSEYDAQINATSVTCKNSNQAISYSDLSNDSLHNDVSDSRCHLMKLKANRPLTCAVKMPDLS